MFCRKIEKIALYAARTFKSLLWKEAQRSTDSHYSFLPPSIIFGPYSFPKPPFLVYKVYKFKWVIFKDFAKNSPNVYKREMLLPTRFFRKWRSLDVWLVETVWVEIEKQHSAECCILPLVIIFHRSCSSVKETVFVYQEFCLFWTVQSTVFLLKITQS